jgi:tetratricopeptide (TPR) repeat protein
MQSIIKYSEDGKFEELIAASLEIANDKKAKPADIALSYQNAAFGALELDDYTRGMEYMQKAIDTDALGNDTHYQLMYQMVTVLLSDEKLEEGLALLDRFITETASTNPDHLALKGNALYQLERFQEAADTLDLAIKASDKPKDSWRELQMAIYSEMERPEDAARVAEQLVASNPDDKRALMNLASIYAQADHFDKATAVLETMRGKGLLTEERDYRQLYAMYLNSENKEAEAITVINEGLAKGILQETAEVYNALAQAYYFTDRYDEAIEAYKKAAPLGKDGEGSLNLARVLSNEERFAESKTAAQDAIARGIKRPGDAWIIIARAEFGLNNNPAMIAAYREAAKFPETKQQAQDWLKRAGKL